MSCLKVNVCKLYRGINYANKYSNYKSEQEMPEGKEQKRKRKTIMPHPFNRQENQMV
jgi:hypothetical protein